MNKILTKQYQQAKREKRLCTHCGWIVTVGRHKQGKRLCASCEDAMRGVVVRGGWGRYHDEPADLTGEML